MLGFFMFMFVCSALYVTLEVDALRLKRTERGQAEHDELMAEESTEQ